MDDMKREIWMKAITGLFVVGLLASTLTGCGSKKEDEELKKTDMTEEAESSSED
jgi:hypothetical protein